jgi:hypothetical protein
VWHFSDWDTSAYDPRITRRMMMTVVVVLVLVLVTVVLVVVVMLVAIFMLMHGIIFCRRRY